jgi:hypothetical protein
MSSPMMMSAGNSRRTLCTRRGIEREWYRRRSVRLLRATIVARVYVLHFVGGDDILAFRSASLGSG